MFVLSAGLYQHLATTENEAVRILTCSTSSSISNRCIIHHNVQMIKISLLVTYVTAILRHPRTPANHFTGWKYYLALDMTTFRSIDVGQVHEYNYSLCKISDDGSYLLPDSIYLIPIKASSIETFAEYYDHWDKYTSMTSYSIGAHASAKDSFIEVSGKFS